MAILGQIRKRSFVLIVVIGMALFAFVISGVFVGSGLSQNQTIGEVNGEKIDYETFNLLVQQTQDFYGLDLINAVNYAWEVGIKNIVLTQELDKLGINAGKDQLEQIVSAEPSIVSNPEFQNDLGLFDFTKFSRYINQLKSMNPTAYNSWKIQEQNVIASAKQKIYFNLITSSITYTDVESNLEYHLENDKVTIDYIKIPFNEIPDSIFKITNSQISNFIKKNKNNYIIDPSRIIEYVFVPDVASPLDENNIRTNLESIRDGIIQYNDVTKLVDSIEGFKDVKNIVEFVETYSEKLYDSIYKTRDQLSGDFRDILYGLRKGKTFGPYKDGNYYVLSKMIDKKREGGVNKVLLANIHRQIVPSNESSNQNYRLASRIEFDAKTNLSLDQNNYSYSVQNYETLNPYDSGIPGISDSRSVIKWIYDESTKVDEIKRFTLTEGYLIGRIKEINKERLPGVGDVSDNVKNEMLKKIKFDYIKKKYKTPTIESIAEDYNMDIQRASAVTQYDPVLVGAGAEPYIIGASFALEPGEVSNLLLGKEGIYIIHSISKEIAEDLNLNSAISRSLSDREIERIFSLIPEVLESSADIKDNRSLYY
ncbi:MAG: SurA N-terminal domain-containing protein [Flavobacteriales bacterium]|nr:SurA N-terminal domain-containing protein [Flavobacteriales bacterium]